MEIEIEYFISLTKMTSKQATWNWTEEHQKAFEHMKKSISRETLLVYPRCYQGTTWGSYQTG